MTWSTPPAPPPPPVPAGAGSSTAHARRTLRAVVGLLALNLGLSLVLTVVTVLARHSIVNYQLDHRHITDPAVRQVLRHGYTYSIVGRVSETS